MGQVRREKSESTLKTIAQKIRQTVLGKLIFQSDIGRTKGLRLSGLMRTENVENCHFDGGLDPKSVQKSQNFFNNHRNPAWTLKSVSIKAQKQKTSKCSRKLLNCQVFYRLI